ncbi:hypothetical protein J2X65_004264 [Ancylobacter sp. 3268]|uniref:hypothetical protein n=1 Tax=Ancylobacter sp. 3268 TaxID=2817752 RepID=UPI002859A883|nr:hypothetical protein [Ancylobacter sp. 3268]MDR6954888.1 hypothetical protein [Ancylobacter sp. 3268]
METLFLVAGTVLSASGQAMAAQEQSRAARFEQEQLKRDEQIQRTAAAQEEARRREELTSQLGTMQSIRAGRGVGMSSPTGMAILTDVASEGTRDAKQAGLNYLLKADSSRMSASMAGQKAKYTLLGGYMDAGATLAGGGYKLMRGV